ARRSADVPPRQLLDGAYSAPSADPRTWSAPGELRRGNRRRDPAVRVHRSVGGRPPDGMIRFILSRVGYSAVSLFLLSLTIFTVVRATGDPAVLLVGPGGTKDDFAQARAHWGLDRPWP